MSGLADGELSTFYLAAKYVYVLLVAVWVALLYRFKRPCLVVAGAVAAGVYAYLVTQAPLARAYALVPGTDRMFNVAMVATASTGHSPFESYQVGFGDHEPFWRWSMSLLSLRDPENVVAVYGLLTPAVTLLLALSLYWGSRGGRGGGDQKTRTSRWEHALAVYSVLLLSSAPSERFGVFDPFWSMTFLLKPNHVLGFVLVPLWMRAFTSPRSLARTLVAALLLSLLSWVFLLHWAYLCAGLALYPLIAKRLGRAPEWRRAWLVGAASLVAALPYVVFLFANFPPVQTTVGRHIWESTSAFREGYWNVFAVSYEHGILFLLSIAGLWVMFRRRRPTDVVWLSLAAGCVAVWGAYLLGFAVRKTVEPEEFYFFTRFVLAVAAGTGAWWAIERASAWISTFRPTVSAVPHGLGVFLLATLPVTLPYWWNPATMDRYFERSRPPVPEEVGRFTAWVREATDPDAVFIADASTASWVAALSGRRVLLTGSMRPPNDYERRRELTERLLTRADREGFVEAREQYHVTHLALDRDWLDELELDSSRFEHLRWLRPVYRDGGLTVYELRLE